MKRRFDQCSAPVCFGGEHCERAGLHIRFSPDAAGLLFIEQHHERGVSRSTKLVCLTDELQQMMPEDLCGLVGCGVGRFVLAAIDHMAAELP